MSSPSSTDVPPNQPRRRLSLPRLLAFAVLTTAAVLAALNWTVETSERAGLLDTVVPDYDVQLVLEPLFEREGDTWYTTPYAAESMVRSRFAATRSGAARVVVSGGSFAMGSPYRFQRGGFKGGGISTYLEQALGQLPEQPVEVLNLAAAGQDSHRVARIAATALEHEPDVLVVASCNNEGAPAPSLAQEALLKHGALRLLSHTLRQPSERSWHTAQDEDTVRVRAAFVSNLDAIARRSGERGVPVVLATLPINLEYRGFDLGHLLGDPGLNDPDWDALRSGLASAPEPLPEAWSDFPPCQAGLQLADAEELDLALPLLQRCVLEPGDEQQLARAAGPHLARAWLARGERVEPALAELDRRFEPCVSRAIAAVSTGDSAAAAEALAQCEVSDPAEALRWRGLALLDGDPEQAVDLLRQSVELKPRNRCRPSFNEAIRQVAARHDHVQLVDLEALYERGSDGAPEGGWFIDYCHMRWEGYAWMGRALLDGVREALELPADAVVEPGLDAIQQRYGLPEGRAAEQVRQTLLRNPG